MYYVLRWLVERHPLTILVFCVAMIAIAIGLFSPPYSPPPAYPGAALVQEEDVPWDSGTSTAYELTYETGDAVELVRDWYSGALSEASWKEDRSNSCSRSDVSYSSFWYYKNSDHLCFTLAAGADITQIKVLIVPR